MNIKTRLLNYLSFKNISKRGFSEEIGLGNSYLTKVNNISGDVIEQIALKYKDLSMEWLIRGKGKMIRNGK